MALYKGEHEEQYDMSRDGDGLFVGHLERLFDQDEDLYGQLIDPRTGEAYDNSSVTSDRLKEFSDNSQALGEIGMHIVELGAETQSLDPLESEEINPWLHTQVGLARAAGFGEGMLEFEDTA